MLYIVDIDRTVANDVTRRPYVENGKSDWENYLNPELVAQDTVIPKAKYCLEKLNLLPSTKEIVFVTGRNESLREVTRNWLEKNIDLDRYILLMRPVGNLDVPSKYKLTQLNYLRYTRLSDPAFTVFDDDLFALKMYEKEGCIVHLAPECWDYLFPNYGELPTEGYWRR